MKTTYYLGKTNGDDEIIAARGDKCYPCPVDSRGNDETSGVNLYDNSADETVAALKTAYGKLIAEGMLYNMDDIERDFPGAIVDFDADDYEELIPIAEVD